jgi:tRNA1Val (adenine37-N6)-methyltransferase
MSQNETIDELRGYDLRIIQPRDGYRFSLDPLLLADFAGMGEGERAIDLGTGCGILPLVLARMSGTATVAGVEFQEDMAELARRNVSLNGLSSRVEIVGADLLDLRKIYPVSSFDLVIANPPYRKQGTGRISPKAGRDKARHETTANLAEFLGMAKYLVRPGGRVCFIYHVSRLGELLAEALHLKLASRRLRMIHGSTMAEAQMVMLEFSKGTRGEMKVLPPLLVYGNNGCYSEDLKRIMGAEDA